MILCAVRNVVSNCKKNFCMLRLQTQKSYGTLRLTYRGLDNEYLYKLYFQYNKQNEFTFPETGTGTIQI